MFLTHNTCWGETTEFFLGATSWRRSWWRSIMWMMKMMQEEVWSERDGESSRVEWNKRAQTQNVFWMPTSLTHQCSPVPSSGITGMKVMWKEEEGKEKRIGGGVTWWRCGRRRDGENEGGSSFNGKNLFSKWRWISSSARMIDGRLNRWKGPKRHESENRIKELVITGKEKRDGGHSWRGGSGSQNCSASNCSSPPVHPSSSGLGEH